MIKAIAIDEELQTLDLIKKFCHQTGYVKCVKCFTRQEEVARYLNETIYRYPQMSGSSTMNVTPAGSQARTTSLRSGRTEVAEIGRQR